jgi:hypothetical protein
VQRRLIVREVLEEARSILILREHLREELRLVVVHAAPTDGEVLNGGLYTLATQGDVVLVLVHEAEDVRQPLVHDLIVFFLNQVFAAENAVVSF